MNFIFYHNLNPILVDYQFLNIRYYGLFFSLFVLAAYLFIYAIWKKNKAEEYCDLYCSIVLICVIVFARLFHVLFYDFEYFFNHPIEILYFWRGGIASHGGVFGGFFGIFLFTKLKFIQKSKIPLFSSYRKLADTMFPSLFAMIFIRLGNFANGEIVGSITEMPVAVSYSYNVYQIPRDILNYYRDQILISENFRKKIISLQAKINKPISEDYLLEIAQSTKLEDEALLSHIISTTPRHFSQFYESFLAIIIFIVIYILYRKRVWPPGFLISLCTFFVFFARFIVEFVKEYQSLVPSDSFLTMGQYLSMPYMIISLSFVLILLIRESKNGDVRSND